MFPRGSAPTKQTHVATGGVVTTAFPSSMHNISTLIALAKLVAVAEGEMLQAALQQTQAPLALVKLAYNNRIRPGSWVGPGADSSLLVVYAPLTAPSGSACTAADAVTACAAVMTQRHQLH